ncbi:hypothetical protein [Abyssisolibacter fermentans]|uniref:hypothetical protein n=1 Tax=Abyssisolibacter fermentans TaxID=1766203 RepID=UPI00082D4AB3|nr:hypothetical protein [Abyssisolibacter fermentans]
MKGYNEKLFETFYTYLSNNTYCQLKLDNDLENANIFLMGEFHGVACNARIEYDLLKYFVINAGVKYYVKELGYNDARKLNEYLRTGDESILKNLLKTYKNCYFATQENYKMWKAIYNFNKTLSNKNKIVVVGIDITDSSNEAIEYIYTCLPQKKIPSQIKYVIDELKNIYCCIKNKTKVSYDYYQFWSTYLISIDKYYDIYKQYFGSNFFDFYMISRNLIAKFKRRIDNLNAREIREQELYENFMIQYKYYLKGNFFGVLGNAHIANGYNCVESFASRLNNNPTSYVRGKVITLLSLYKNCKSMTPYQGTYEKNNINSPMVINEIFNPFYKENEVLIKLNEKNTPFITKNMSQFKLPILKKFLTNNIQYCILMNGAEASSPL